MENEIAELRSAGQGCNITRRSIIRIADGPLRAALEKKHIQRGFREVVAFPSSPFFSSSSSFLLWKTVCRVCVYVWSVRSTVYSVVGSLACKPVGDSRLQTATSTNSDSHSEVIAHSLIH